MALNPDPVDIHVGRRVRLRRTLLGMSQGKLGEAVGITFQQIQKYERGTNRIGSGRLYQLAQVLDIPVSYFFDDMSSDIAAKQAPGLADEGPPSFEGDRMAKREALEFMRAYYAITDSSARKRLFELVKAIGAPFHSEDGPEEQ